MRELLTLATYELFFIFDQVMYRQTDGIAMGSPLGLILVNAFLCHLEKQWFSECPPVKEIKFDGVWGKLEAKKCFQRQTFTKYLRLTLASM